MIEKYKFGQVYSKCGAKHGAVYGYEGKPDVVYIYHTDASWMSHPWMAYVCPGKEGWKPWTESFCTASEAHTYAKIALAMLAEEV